MEKKEIINTPGMTKCIIESDGISTKDDIISDALDNIWEYAREGRNPNEAKDMKGIGTICIFTEIIGKDQHIINRSGGDALALSNAIVNLMKEDRGLKTILIEAVKKYKERHYENNR